MTKGQLYNWHMEIQQLQMSGSVIAYFNHNKIKEFYNEYKIRLESIIKDITDIQKKHMEFDAAGQIIKSGELNNLQPVFIEGHTKEDLDQEFQALMMQDMTDKNIQVVQSILGMDGKQLKIVN